MQWCGEILQISDFPNAVYSSIPLGLRRYCMMHSCANILSNTLSNLYNYLPPRSSNQALLHRIVHQVNHKWNFGNTLRCLEMKKFFDSQYHLGIGPLFNKTQQQHELMWNQEPHTFHLSTPKMVTLLFDSIRVFKQFAYTTHPSPSDYRCLHIARNCYWEGIPF